MLAGGANEVPPDDREGAPGDDEEAATDATAGARRYLTPAPAVLGVGQGIAATALGSPAAWALLPAASLSLLAAGALTLRGHR